MAIDHSLHAVIEFKPGVTVDQALEAIQPLADARGWSAAQIKDPSLRMDDNVTTKTNGEFVSRITIFTFGPVPDSFEQAVEETAEKLAGLAYPASFDLQFSDAHHHHAAHRFIWYGTPEEVSLATRTFAIDQAFSLLHAAGIGGESFSGLSLIGKVLKSIGTPVSSTENSSGLSDISVLIASLAFLVGEKALDIRNLANESAGRADRKVLFGEAITAAKAAGAVYAVQIPNSGDAWYCFSETGKLVCHLVPFYPRGHKFVAAPVL